MACSCFVSIPNRELVGFQLPKGYKSTGISKVSIPNRELVGFQRETHWLAIADRLIVSIPNRELVGFQLQESTILHPSIYASGFQSLIGN